MGPDHFLFEKIIAHECCGGSADGGRLLPTTVRGCQLHQSHDGQHLAIIEPNQQAVSIVPLEGSGKALQPSRFSASPLVAVGKSEASVSETFTSVAWSADGQQLVVAGLTGSLYLLDRSATTVKVWMAHSQRLPWAHGGGYVSGLAFVNPSTLLLATSTARLYTVPLGAAPEVWASLKPRSLTGVHVDVRGCGYLHSNKVLVLTGLGAEGSKCPGVCVSLWKWQDKGLSSMPFAWHGKAQVSTAVTSSITQPWSVSFSPGGEFVAVAPAPHRLLLVSLADGVLVPTTNNLPADSAPLMQGPSSVAWVTDASLAVTTPAGALGLAQLPALVNILGVAGKGLEQCMPGSVVSIKSGGTDTGLVVVEPQPSPHVAWRLSLLARRSPDQLLAVLLAQHEWATAAQLCNMYNLDADSVHRARWSSASITPALVDECLACMSDQQWVCHEVVGARCAADADTQRHLISHALDVTTRMCQELAQAEGSEGGYDGEEARLWRRMRLVLLRHMDRLNLLLALHGGLYDMDAFAQLRDAPLVEVAQAWASLGNVPALTTLLSAAPCTLGPHLLMLLNCLPETLDPRTYSHLLPRADGAALSLPVPTKGPTASAADAPLVSLEREPDWVESSLTGRELEHDGHTDLCEATECMAAVTRGVPPQRLQSVPADEADGWYCERAVHLDISSRQLAGAVALLELGAAKGAAAGGRMSRLLRHARVLLNALPALSTSHLGCDGPAWLMTLDLFSSLQPLDQLRIIMRSSTEDTLPTDITDRIAPFLLSQPAADTRQLLVDFLARELSSRPSWCALLVAHEAQRPRLIPDVLQLAQVTCAALAHSRTSEALEHMQDMLQSLQEAVEQATTAALTAGDTGRQQACASASASLEDVSNWVEAGALLTQHDVHMTVPELHKVDTHAAQAIVQRMLNRAQSLGAMWSNTEWSGLWAHLRQLQDSVLAGLPARQVMHEYVSVLLRAGRLDLAKSYLNGTGSVPISPEECSQLVVSVASEMLARVTDMRCPEAERAQAILALAPATNEGKLMVARVCVTTGDWEMASAPLIELVDEGVEGAAPLAAQLARSKTGRQLGPDTRARLVSFAALHAAPQDLPALTDDLMVAQAAALPSGFLETVGADPHYHVRCALSQPEHALPLPSYGDVPLALAALSAAQGTEAVEQLVSGLVGEAGTLSMARFATLQRGLLVGIHTLALRALQLGGAPEAQWQQWQQVHPTALLQQAEAAQLSSPEAQAAVRAARGLAQTLQAASDGRAVRTVVPSAQATDFLGGDVQQRAQALLQQACVAGQQAGGLAPDGNTAVSAATSVASGQKLLDHALQLCQQYNVSAWDVRLEFVCAAVHAATTVAPELRQQLLSHWQALLQPTPEKPEPAPLLLSALSSVMWVSTPATSASHLSTLLALLLACLPATSPPPPSTTLQRLNKLADLLDKAGGALRGLSLRQILTPLMRNALGGMQLPAPPTVHSGGSGVNSGPQASLISQRVPSAGLDPDLPSLVAEAQAAVYAYSSQQTVGATGKLLKAMQAIFAPAPGTADAPESAGQVKVLSSLPMSLPYFCLLCKACSTHSGSGVPAAGMNAEAWAGVRDACLGKVSPGQLRAWMDFMLMGARQPLSSAVAGRLTPETLSASLQLCVIRDGLLSLPECGAEAAAQASKPLPDTTVRLLQLYSRLRVQAALASSMLPQQTQGELDGDVARACEEAAATKGQGGASAQQLLCQVIQAQLASGVPMWDILMTATNAWPEPSLAVVACGISGYAAGVLPAQLITQQVDTGLRGLLSSFQPSGTEADSGAATSGSPSQGLRMLVQSLASGPDAVMDGSDTSHDELVDSLRRSVLQSVAGCVQGLEAWQFSQPEASALLQVHVTLVSGQAWPGWQSGSDAGVEAGADATRALDSRVLLAATLSHLAPSWSPLPAIRLEDLESITGATTCFISMVQQAQPLPQLEALTQLLVKVWAHGSALPHAAGEGGEQGDQGGAVPLHACWLAVMRRAAQAGHYQLFLSVLTQMAQPHATALLTALEADSLVHELAAAPGQDSTAAALAALLATSVPYVEVQATCPLLFQQHAQGMLLDAQHDVAHALASACLANRLLLQPALTAHAQGCIQQAMVSFAMRERSNTVNPLLLPCTVAQLCMGHRFGVAGSLAAHACRWSSALQALGGNLNFLNHFLESVAFKPRAPAPGVLAPLASSWLAEAIVAVREATAHS